LYTRARAASSLFDVRVGGGVLDLNAVDVVAVVVDDDDDDDAVWFTVSGT